MKKRIALFVVIALMVGLLLVTAVPVFACDCGCPADCSPGFWKQPHHFQYWVGYEQDDPYFDTGMTLLEALQGGKATRESRFVVAGWLNEANPDAPCY